MDRAGLVGADGATHCGFADIAYMGCVPNMIVMAVRPGGGRMLIAAWLSDDCPGPLAVCCCLSTPSLCLQGAWTSQCLQYWQCPGHPLASTTARTAAGICRTCSRAWQTSASERCLEHHTRMCASPVNAAQPSNEAELCNAVATAVAIDDKPSCLRFPRGNGLGVDLSAYNVGPDHKGQPWEVKLSLCLLTLVLS